MSSEDLHKREVLDRYKVVGRSLHWGSRAVNNTEKWGIQHPEELLSAITEELGELEQAYLEATHDSGDADLVIGEIDDLAPLLFQLLESLEEHPQAFQRLPTVEEVEE